MKKVLITGLLLCSTLLCASSNAKKNEQPLDQIIAVINDDVVTKTEFNRALATAKVQIVQERVPMPPENVLDKQVLDQLINKKLQLQIAKLANINVTDTDLNNAVQHIAEQNHMSVKELYQRINHEGMSTTDYRTEMHDQMTMQKLQQQEIVSHITITPQEVATFLHSKAWQNNTSKEYRLEDILIPVAEAPSTTEIVTARKRAENVMTRLNQGKSFQQVAQSESGDTHALQGGDLGFRKLPEIPSAFAEQVVTMKPKEIAGPIQAPNGFHIIRLVDVRATSEKQAAPDRKQVEELLLQRKFEEAVQNWVSKLRSQAFIVNNLNA
jgi:peptidyl-prolyl cis-trans isomerase SurA